MFIIEHYYPSNDILISDIEETDGMVDDADVADSITYTSANFCKKGYVQLHSLMFPKITICVRGYIIDGQGNIVDE
jgi:hypothetical protein